jgi:hypothetical protein
VVPEILKKRSSLVTATFRHTVDLLMNRILAFPVAALGGVLCCTAVAQQETYNNPVDHQAYTAPGGWQSYEPDGDTSNVNEKITLAEVRLLQSQEEIAARTTVEELAAFVDQAHKIASQVFASYGKSAVILVQFECLPDKCSPRLAYQGSPPEELLQAYYDRLERLQPLRVTRSVKFQFTLRVRP